jgi:hypothetical protein
MAQFVDLPLLVCQKLFQLPDLGSQICSSKVCSREGNKEAQRASDQRDGAWFG